MDGGDTESKTTRVSPNLSLKLTNWLICLNKANAMKFHALLNLQLIASRSGSHLHSKPHCFTSMISTIFWLFLQSSRVENSCPTFLCTLLVSATGFCFPLKCNGQVTFLSLFCHCERGVLSSVQLRSQMQMKSLRKIF